jgi:hypothetical protein
VKRALLVGIVLGVGFARGALSIAEAQTCIVPAPATPPVPTQLVINLPLDGGTQGCTTYANVPGASKASNYALGAAKCATSVGIAKQAAAIDNGWDDGGVP